jgi:hypothetical protein
MHFGTYRIRTEVQKDGRIEVTVPLPPGSRVEVVVHTESAEVPGGLTEGLPYADFWDMQLEDVWSRP